MRSNDPVLHRFRTGVAEIYDDRLERDSDADIAIFLREAGTFMDESERLAAVSTDILLDTGAVIPATPFLARAYRERT